MLRNLQHIKTPICHMLLKLKYSELESAFWRNWEIIEEVVLIIEPLHYALMTLMDVQFPPVSAVFPIFYEVTHRMEEITDQKLNAPMGNQFSNSLGGGVEQYLLDLNTSFVHIRSTFLDPRYKSLILNTNAVNKAIQELPEEFTKYVSSTPNGAQQSRKHTQ